ncbi:EAL domain-containing protein [Microbulbifer yueqingensis]|uniref:PAS domain S-box-containing protein/diguanylate cyclase (GGDEF) domain-containing protein n=1 Tax=Microbulbifer yueqingensis TaxID=658219 RepID=A0A1G8X0V6_9GAMM|nr:EAL domain-containing protein [Microbulbifer yueqingensis]SDJ84074.1 PAS domain S-box-containing protein/diguanylate cyclase (GGDEF) domain-containing protein [Microbulbifer yueqingensis]
MLPAFQYPGYKHNEKVSVPVLWESALALTLLSAALIVFSKTALSEDGGAAFLWLGDAVAVAYLYRHPVRHWPVLFTSFFAASFFAGLWLGVKWEMAAKYTIGSLAEILLAAALLRRFCPRHDYFMGVKQWMRFLAVSTLIPPLASASVGCYFVMQNNNEVVFRELFTLWYTADAMGMLILLPIMLLVEDAMETRGGWQDWAEFALVTVAVTALAWMLLEYKAYPFVFISLVLLGAATRLSLFASLLVICIASITMAMHLSSSTGLPQPAPAGLELSQVQLVIATFAAVIPAYLVAVFTNIERRRNERSVEMESSFRAAVEESRLGILRVSLEGRILQVNRSFCEFLGYAADEIVGRSVLELTYRDDWDSSRDLLERFAANGGQPFSVEKRYQHRDGHAVWGELRVSVARSLRGEPLYMLSQVEDIDWRKRSEASLLEAKERLQVTLASITDAVISTDEKQRVNYINPMAESLTGWPQREALGRPVDEVCNISSGSSDTLGGAVAECLAQSQLIHGGEGATLHSRGGRRYDITWSVSPLRKQRGELLGAVLVIQDVSEQRELIRQLSYKASHDGLTGLPNRDAFKGELESAIDDVNERGTRHALVFLDLDRFKVINDSAGHVAGDGLLREISQSLSGQLLKSDSIARLGGDEFGLLFRHCDRARAKERCEAILRNIGLMRFPWNNRVYDVGASAGITEISPDNNHLGDLLSQADVACFSAKRLRRGTAVSYDMEKSAAVDQHREILMASVIRDAIDNSRFSLDMQPIADASNTSRVSHYELLLRMYDEKGKLLMPDAFVPAAERYGLMLPIDRWVVDETLVKHAGAIAEAGFSFALNISADALGDAGFQVHLLEVLDRTPIPRERISFEITETAMVTHMESASRFVAGLRKLGCRIALDDFGNGLSSFSYLKSFTIDYIKIDGSFVRQVEENFVDLIIVESIHQVAQRLGARTVAEFVEDEATLQRMAALGVNLVQGYYIGHPRPLQKALSEAESLAGGQVEAEALSEGTA